MLPESIPRGRRLGSGTVLPDRKLTIAEGFGKDAPSRRDLAQLKVRFSPEDTLVRGDDVGR